MDPDTVNEALVMRLDSLINIYARLDSLGQVAPDQNDNFSILLCASAILFSIVLIILPTLATCITIADRKNKSDITLKGLALPQGSVRSMLALLIIGSFMIVALIGSGISALEENFNEVLSALTGIAGAVVGFYFGSKGSGGTSNRQDPNGSVPSQQP